MISLKVIGSSSKGNAYLIDNGTTKVLLDCGAKQVINEDLTKIDGILLTHEHGDHIGQIGQIKDYFNGKYYSHKDVLDILPVIDSQKVEVKAGEKFEIGTFSCIGFELMHDVKCYGWLLKDNISGYKLLYITDTGSIGQYKFKDIDAFLIESNCFESDLTYEDYKEVRLYNTHLSCEQTANFLKENVNYNTKIVLLAHISHSEENYKRHEEFIKKELNKSQIGIIALNPHMKEPMEFILKEDLDFNFD